MNRPPKKKKAPEASAERHSHASAAEERPANQDDRNLVNIDQAFREADVEDKVWLFWEANKGRIIGLSVLALIAVLAIQGYGYYQRQADRALQGDYQKADTEEAYQSFGQAHPGRPLGAFALLQAADAEYAAQKYSEAAKLYGEAINGLAGTPFYGRAQLGQGVALIKSGDEQTGKAKLTTLTSDASALETIRGEAAFNLALLAMADDDFTGANEWLKKVKTIANESIWSQQADALVNNSPELQALAAPMLNGESTIQVQAASNAIPEVQPDTAEESAVTAISESDATEDAE